MKTGVVPFISKRYDGHPQPWLPFGAPNREEYDKWSPEVCGICCLKMAGDAFGKTQGVSVYELTMETLANGGYKSQSDGSIKGVFYKPLLKVARYYGLDGAIERNLTLSRVKSVLKSGGLAVLSIDKAQINPVLQGGHLVLVWSYDEKNNIFLIHDSDSLLSKTGKSVRLQDVELTRISNNRGFSLVTRGSRSWIGYLFKRIQLIKWW